MQKIRQFIYNSNTILLKFSDYSGEGPTLLGKYLPLPWRDCTDFWEEHRPWADAKQEVTRWVITTSLNRVREEQNYPNMNVLRETKKRYSTNTSVIKYSVRQFLHKFQTRLHKQQPSSIHCSQLWDLCLRQGQTICRADQFKSEN